MATRARGKRGISRLRQRLSGYRLQRLKRQPLRNDPPPKSCKILKTNFANSLELFVRLDHSLSTLLGLGSLPCCYGWWGPPPQLCILIFLDTGIFILGIVRTATGIDINCLFNSLSASISHLEWLSLKVVLSFGGYEC